MIVIRHLITGLGMGGAEMMLCKLLSLSDRRRYVHEVVSLTGPGPMAGRIEALGIPVSSLAMRGGPRRWLAAYRRLRESLTADPPDLLQSWMYHADLLAALTRPKGGGVPLIWGIRQSDFAPPAWIRPTYGVARLCARLSHEAPERIVCCSEVAARLHAGIGYDRRRMVVIPNGFDLDRFVPDEQARAVVRRELGLAAEAPLVGVVGRFDPQKDHRGFVRAAARVKARFPEARFLFCGQGLDGGNRRLRQWIDEAGLDRSVILLGLREDIPRVLAALDVFVSSSAYGEGFPNVVGEAMACAVPCVVTDVGDSARIVGETGRVVRPGDPVALAGAIGEVLALDSGERRAIGGRARRRIAERYGLPAIVRRYEALYDELTAPCAA